MVIRECSLAHDSVRQWVCTVQVYLLNNSTAVIPALFACLLKQPIVEAVKHLSCGLYTKHPTAVCYLETFY